MAPNRRAVKHEASTEPATAVATETPIAKPGG